MIKRQRSFPQTTALVFNFDCVRFQFRLRSFFLDAYCPIYGCASAEIPMLFSGAQQWLQVDSESCIEGNPRIASTRFLCKSI